MAEGPVPAYSKVPPPRPGGTVSGWLVAVLLILVAALYLKLNGLWPSRLFNPDQQLRAITPRGDLAEDEKSTIKLFQTVNQSVVHIRTSAVVQDMRMNVFEIPRGSGSGFIWDSSGYVVTNFHVVRDAVASGGRILVSLPNRPTAYAADKVGADPSADLAVLKIHAPPADLKPVMVGNSADLQVGQKCFAIGSPFSLDHSLSTGIISGLNREIDSESGSKLKDVIQVTAAINPGNSGGPLLDSAGRLIGVTTAIASTTGVFSGVGFAIPVDAVNTVVTQLIRSGASGSKPTGEPPALGVTLYPNEVTARLRAAGYLDSEGALVKDVVPGGAAEEAGIQPSRVNGADVTLGDLIVAADGKANADARALMQAIASKKVGDVVKLTVVRNGKPIDVPVTLRARPNIQQQ